MKKQFLLLFLGVLLSLLSCKKTDPTPSNAPVTYTCSANTAIIYGRWHATQIFYTDKHTPSSAYPSYNPYDSIVINLSANGWSDSSYQHKYLDLYDNYSLSGYTCTQIMGGYFSYIKHDLYYTILDKNTITIHEVFNDSLNTSTLMTLKRVIPI